MTSKRTADLSTMPCPWSCIEPDGHEGRAEHRGERAGGQYRSHVAHRATVHDSGRPVPGRVKVTVDDSETRHADGSTTRHPLFLHVVGYAVFTPDDVHLLTGALVEAAAVLARLTGGEL